MVRPRRSWAELTLGVLAVAGVTVAATALLPADGQQGSARRPPSAGPAVRAPAGPPAVQRLSRPGHVSRYAFVDRPTVVRAAPDARARPLGTLRTRTPDGTDELVLALARTRDARGRAWLRVRTPLLPAGTVGWIPRAATSTLHRVSTLAVIDRRTLRLRVVRNGRTIMRAPVGVGTRTTPTPAGRFYVRDRLVGLDPRGLYGPEALGTSARSTKATDWPGGDTVGIHGTNRPELLPGRVSHGCIRMRNRDIRRLARVLPVGSPVTIR